MTVDSYLRSLVYGLDIPDNVIERCARSPKNVVWHSDSGDVKLSALPLTADIDDYDDEPTFQVQLDYASATVYYAVLAVFSGGGYTEKRGNVQFSRSGYTITQSDRDRFKMLADQLRQKWGFDIDTDGTEDNGMFDASYMRLNTLQQW